MGAMIWAHLLTNFDEFEIQPKKSAFVHCSCFCIYSPNKCAFMQLHPIQFLFQIPPKMRTSHPKVVPLVAKGLNARKYPGVCALAWYGMLEEGDGGPWRGGRDLEQFWQLAPMTSICGTRWSSHFLVDICTWIYAYAAYGIGPYPISDSSKFVSRCSLPFLISLYQIWQLSGICGT